MFKVNSNVYSANSVGANTDITSNLKPNNALGFKIIGLKINCSVAAKIELNNTDKVQCTPDTSGYSASVNLDSNFFVEIEKVKIIDACNINAMTVFYTVNGYSKKLSAPVLDHASGAYALPFKLDISQSEGAKVYYTTNGDTPTSESTLYESPIEVESAETIKAIAIAETEEFTNSDVVSGVYTKLKVAKPSANPPAGEVESGTLVALACETEGALITYKLGSGAETPYTEPIAISEAVTIKATASLDGATTSDTLTAAYTIAEAVEGE